jgi:hypothetical protein
MARIRRDRSDLVLILNREKTAKSGTMKNRERKGRSEMEMGDNPA